MHPNFKAYWAQVRSIFWSGRNVGDSRFHAALATHHSGPLGVLIEGPMCEAQNRVAELDDTDGQTFVRF